MDRVAYVGRMQRDLEPALLARVESARRADGRRPLTILVGSNLLAAHLGRALARRLDGVFNVRFMTYMDVARALASTAPGGPRSPVPPLAGRVILEELLAGVDVPAVFGGAAAMNGFSGALSATFADLSEGGCTAEVAGRMLAAGERGGRLSEKTRATLELFARYRRRVEEAGGDLHSIFQDALRGRANGSFGSTIFVYGFYDLNEMQRRLLDHLASRVDLELFVPWRGGDEAYRFASPLRERLAGEGFLVCDAGEGRGPGFGGARDAPALLSCPGEEEEIREIARRILTLARERAIPFEEMAVLLASRRGYENLVGETFDEAGIPYAIGDRPLTASSPAARAVRALLAILEHGLDRRELVEFLASAPLAAPETEGENADYISLWIRRSAEAGMTGERGWIEENDSLVERIAAAVERGRESPRSLRAAERAGRLLRSIAGARDAMRTGETWTGFSERLAGIIRSLFTPSTDAESVCEIIESLGRLDAVECAATLPRFLRLADAAIEEARAPRLRPEGGVAVMSLREARGLSFQAAFLPGLAEGVFPGPLRQDPFLPDGERALLERASAGEIALPRRGERIAEDALLFAMALESAGARSAVTVPRFEQGTGKERIPSFFLRYAGFDAAGGAASGPGTIRLGRGGAERRGVELLSLDEYDFESARAELAGGGACAANRFFLRGASLVRGRWGSSEFTAYDGVLSSARARAELVRALETGGYRFAPTALERWAGCPFAYFLQDLLGIEAIEEPERIVTVTPAQRGSLVHGILARAFEAFASAGLLPLRCAPPERLFAVADDAVSRMLDEFPQAEPVGLPVFWEMERRIVKESIRFFLSEERLETDEFVPAAFEQQFGRGDERTAVAHDRGDRLVYFHGRIDRLDVAPDGRFRVVDYKTGRLSQRGQDLGGGSTLQLPVYLLAAARILGRSVEEGEAQYRRVGAGAPRRVLFSGDRWSECSGEFANIVETATRGIEEGLFFARGGPACDYCDFKTACAPGAERLFERKARRDPRARGYLSMRGMDEEER